MASSQLLKGKVGLVTGAGSPYGIGRSLVLALAKAGVSAVYACDLNLNNIASLQAWVKEAGSTCKVEGKILDVSSEEQTLGVIKEILKEHGRFDFFFANAGFANYRNINDLTVENFDRAMSVMVRSIYLAVKLGSQAMMVTSADKPTHGGTIVATSSCAAYLGAYADFAYTTAKKAVNGAVEAGSVQLSTSNIRCNGIAPGFTQTSILTSSKLAEKGEEYNIKATEAEIQNNHKKFFDAAGLLDAQQYYYNRTAGPEEIANIGVFLASDLASAINGQTILADSGKTIAATGEGCTGKIPLVRPLEF